MSILPNQFFDILILLLVMFNPFLMSIYLIELIQSLSSKRFSYVIFRAFWISSLIFIGFAFSGDYLFQSVLQIHFGSFMIFGGILFTLISLQQMISGPKSINLLRGPIEHIGGAATLPFMLGPGTISTSIYAGSVLSPTWTIIVIVSASLLSAFSLIMLKVLFSRVAIKKHDFMESYINIIGRMMALIMGSIAVNMIIKGIQLIIT
tara:strand:- start:393 stop:1010 length:618 start_codon:yes stop_codon:yes gene_type:complete